MFQVGDKIIMNGLADDAYGCTRSGSTGTILEVDEQEIKVAFDLLTGYSDPTSIFWVEKCHCELLTIYSREERVIKKIKQMETRWLKFQTNKRSCHVQCGG